MTDVNIAAHEYELRLRVKLLEAQLTNAKEKSDALDNEVQKLRAELARNMRETGIDETVDGLCHRISEHKEAQTANSIAIQDIQQNIVKAQAQIEALTQVPNPNASVNQLGHGRKRRNASPMAPPFKKGKNIQILDDDAVIQKLPLTSFDAIQFENGPLSRFFRCSSATIESNTSRGTKTLELLAQLVNFKDATDHDALLRIIISEVLKRLPYDKEDKIGFQVWGGDMEQPFFFPARTADQNNLDTFVNEFEKLSQSATLVNILNTDLRFKATAYKSKQYYGSAGTDNLCLFEAVSKCLTQANPTFEVPSTEKLLKLSQLPQKDAYGIDDVKILQGLLLTTFDTRLVLLDMDGNQLFRGERAKRDIFIQFDETKKHYMACLEVKKLFPKARGYCADCDVPIRTHPHRKYCVATCRRCNRYGPAFPCTQAPDYTPRRCADCNVFFLSDDCFDAHKSDRNEKGRLVIPVCNKRTTCKQCNHVIDVRSDKKHACWKVERECYLCKQQHPDGEVFCYIQPLPQKRYKRTIYCFFDCEATQNEGKHVCNVLVAEFSCDVCMKLETDPSSTEKGDTCFCTGKHKGKYVFTSFDGGNPVREFIRILTHKHRGAEAYEIIAISHNGGKYDDHIILEELQQMNIAPRIVSTGFKIFSLTIDSKALQKVIFKDSFNFLQCPLAAFPATFEFPEDMEKQFFPHKFNTRANLNACLDQLPDAKFYEPNGMTEKQRKLFSKWYSKHRTSKFDMKKELVSYCELDVAILRKGIMAFTKTMHELCGFAPFKYATTLPKLALLAYRTNHLRPNRLGHTPEMGYRKNEIQSEKALKYMLCYAHQHNVTVRTAEWSAGEYKIPGSNYRIDGLVLNSKGQLLTGLEFHGCYFHGCNVCHPDDAILANGKKCHELREETMRRIDEIRKHIKIQEKWEHDFDRDLRSDKLLREYYDSIVIPPRMELRKHVLRGGRTEAFYYIYVPNKHEEIVAVDFVSMYPTVMKTKKFPLGHPKVLTREVFEGNPEKVLEYDGFAFITVRPPSNLSPVFLHLRTKDKRLVFPLCGACAESQQKVCDHDDDEKCWTAGYTTVEIRKAVSLGYKVLKTFEVWHYSKWSNTPGEEGLFNTFVDTFVREKLQNSGWDGLLTDAEKAAFVAECKEKTGIDIDINSVTFNSGKRYCAKLMLNSLWGKLSQRNDFSMVLYTNSAVEFHKVMNDDRYEVLDFVHVTKQMDRIVVKYKEHMVPERADTSLAIACHVTAYGRLMLYEAMEKTNGKILYCDTDSIYYARRLTDEPLETGSHLGCLSREYPNRRITCFVAAGPKNYGFEHTNPDGTDKQAVRKVRGFKFTYEAQKVLTFEKIKEMILEKCENDVDATLAVPSRTITRTKMATLHTKTSVKQWGPVYAKSVCSTNGVILPFGYNRYA